MRVAFDTSSMRGQKTGIGVYTENLLCALHKTAPDIEIVSLDDGVGANQRTDRRIWREQITIPRLTQRARADLLHLTGFAAPRRVACPLVLTVHDLIGVLFAKNFPPMARFYWSRWLPFTLRSVTRLIADSENTKRDVVHLAGIPAERVRVILPGRDEKFHPTSDAHVLETTRRELGLPARFILFVSTLEPRKGVDTLITVFEQIATIIPDDLVLVGKRGWYWEKLFAQVKHTGLENRIRLLEYVPDEKMPLIYSLARVFVFPSRYEGFGLPPLEAMACGTPVVSSNAASLPEVIGDAGVLIPPNDIDAFARAIVQAINDANLRVELRERGLRQAQKFSWTRTAQETVTVYRELYHE